MAQPKTARGAANALVNAINKIEKPKVKPKDLNEAIYTLNEGGQAFNGFDENIALRCWRLVEWLKDNPLPDDWKM